MKRANELSRHELVAIVDQLQQQMFMSFHDEPRGFVFDPDNDLDTGDACMNLIATLASHGLMPEKIIPFSLQDNLRDCGEGIFPTQQEAIEFAIAEVGVPWTIRHEDGGWVVKVAPLQTGDAMTAVETVEPGRAPLPADLRCPKCGSPDFLYVEDIACSRRVVAYEDDILLVHGLYETEGFDEGENPRVQCAGCCEEFECPEECEFE